MSPEIELGTSRTEGRALNQLCTLADCLSWITIITIIIILILYFIIKAIIITIIIIIVRNAS